VCTVFVVACPVCTVFVVALHTSSCAEFAEQRAASSAQQLFRVGARRAGDDASGSGEDFAFEVQDDGAPSFLRELARQTSMYSAALGGAKHALPAHEGVTELRDALARLVATLQGAPVRTFEKHAKKMRLRAAHDDHVRAVLTAQQQLLRGRRHLATSPSRATLFDDDDGFLDDLLPHQVCKHCWLHCPSCSDTAATSTLCGADCLPGPTASFSMYMHGPGSYSVPRSASAITCTQCCVEANLELRMTVSLLRAWQQWWCQIV
jgi:hypothetical protein